MAVVPATLLTSLSVSDGTTLVLSWSGGLPDRTGFQMANDLLPVSPAWQDLSGSDNQHYPAAGAYQCRRLLPNPEPVGETKCQDW